MRVAAGAAFLSASLALAQTGAGTDTGTSTASPDATKGVSEPRRGESRRSGVAGAPMDPGSGAQGSGTEEGPDGGGLTGSEGQDDTDRDIDSEP